MCRKCEEDLGLLLHKDNCYCEPLILHLPLEDDAMTVVWGI